jgi:hypothetical protein
MFMSVFVSVSLEKRRTGIGGVSINMNDVYKEGAVEA